LFSRLSSRDLQRSPTLVVHYTHQCNAILSTVLPSIIWGGLAVHVVLSWMDDDNGAIAWKSSKLPVNKTSPLLSYHGENPILHHTPACHFLGKIINNAKEGLQSCINTGTVPSDNVNTHVTSTLHACSDG
jgi:hypothetical protein